MSSKALANLQNIDLMTGELVETVEKIFHIEDLFKLSQKNSFLALNFFQLMCNIDYVILTPGRAAPVGSTNISAEILELLFGFQGIDYPFSLRGKLAAVAECFRVQASKMDALISVDVITAFMQGTGAAQIAQDAVNAFLGAGTTAVNTAVSGGGKGGKVASSILPEVAAMAAGL
jgi:hypothetical protein